MALFQFPLPIFLSDPYRGSNLEWAIWQFVLVLLVALVLVVVVAVVGTVRSEFIDEL